MSLGSGYWSVDGAVQVLGLGGDAAAVEVRWPDGSQAEIPVEGRAEVTVTWGGGR